MLPRTEAIRCSSFCSNNSHTVSIDDHPLLLLSNQRYCTVAVPLLLVKKRKLYSSTGQIMIYTSALYSEQYAVTELPSKNSEQSTINRHVFGYLLLQQLRQRRIPKRRRTLSISSSRKTNETLIDYSTRVVIFR